MLMRSLYSPCDMIEREQAVTAWAEVMISLLVATALFNPIGSNIRVSLASNWNRLPNTVHLHIFQAGSPMSTYMRRWPVGDTKPGGRRGRIFLCLPFLSSQSYHIIQRQPVRGPSRMSSFARWISVVATSTGGPHTCYPGAAVADLLWPTSRLV